MTKVSAKWFSEIYLYIKPSIMIGLLTQQQSEYILQCNTVGRIGCYANNKVLIIPITYVFSQKCIYGHSWEGTKISMMRKNPQVCFQVDSIDNLANWRSVIAWGKFEELKTEVAQNKVIRLFHERLAPLMLGETVNVAREFADPPHIVQKKRKPILYRIGLTEVTGRYEKQTTL
jgi:nitroimidazol reductase NimA-like FMN-containing flavoprotein (pyridoxamine 5'-phosphate oxidase superfamily)